MRRKDGRRTAPPYRINLALLGVMLAASCLLIAVVPVIAASHFAAAAILAFAIIALTPLHSVLLHEAIHGRLAGSPSRNRLAGRALAVAFGLSFEVVRFGHLLHHGYNRHALDRPDILDRGKNGIASWIAYYSHLLGGVYLAEIAASLVFFLPRPTVKQLIIRSFPDAEPASAAVRRAVLKVADDTRLVTRIRADGIAFIALYGMAFWLYAAYWPLLLAALLARGITISLMDNAPHYGTPAIINAPARNMSTPAWLGGFLLNQNLHALHHERPDLPWTALKQTFIRSGAAYDGSYAAALTRQFRGPIPRERLIKPN